jgi:hypothetical protein
MKIELKSIKYAKFASEETNCYKAAIYIDGKRVGDVSNDGRGGCDNVNPWTVAKIIDEYAKTLPKIICDWIDPKTNLPAEIEQTHETIFGDLINDWLIDKDLKKLLGSKVVYTKEDGKLYGTVLLKPLELASKLAQSDLTERLSAKLILNQLPYSHALQIFKATLSRRK